MGDSETANDSSSERLDLMEREIRSLQSAMISKMRPWHSRVATLLSALALLFSFGTTYVSYQKSIDQEIQNDKNELTKVLQRLAALPKENLDLNIKYEHDKNIKNFLSSYIEQENILLSRQAMGYIAKLPASQVTATENIAVALALQAYNDTNTALIYAKKAIKISQCLNDAAASSRMVADYLFKTGSIEDGRKEFELALNIPEKYSANKYLIESEKLSTLKLWFWSELYFGNPDQAKACVSKAREIVEKSSLPAMRGYSSDIDTLDTALTNAAKP